MCQDVDVMTNIAWWGRMLLFPIFALLWFFHLYLTLHVGLFDHLHLQEHSPSYKIQTTPADDMHTGIRTSSFGLMLYRILSAVSLSWRLSIIARRSLEALFCKKPQRNNLVIKLLFWIYNWVHVWCNPTVWTCTEVGKERSYYASQIVDIAVRRVWSLPSCIMRTYDLRLGQVE